ncbi:hypothetical protein Acr_00g0075010 [Actinidia rufa]|uniref:Uncharacterized protein n=1 Tax=Actinidia rufa TaxID=165716 RepID=A0A7J0DSJ2_9ERIC|nr:hypothetical protein Acr_00g0075010 [Actinidia rufa]
MFRHLSAKNNPLTTISRPPLAKNNLTTTTYVQNPQAYTGFSPSSPSSSYSWPSPCLAQIRVDSQEDYDLSSSLSNYFGHTFLGTTTTIIQSIQPTLVGPKTIPSGSQKKYYNFCRRDNHSYEDCRSCYKPKRKGYYNRHTATVTNSIEPSPDFTSSSTLITADVETIVTQVLSRTNIQSSALSTTLGSADGENHWDQAQGGMLI